MPSYHDGKPYSGYYTQREIKEIVEYASERMIEVIPEIEMPGHCLAALASYPELSCSGGPFEVARGWGVFEDVFCTKEPVFVFLQGVLDEVCELFPGKYIHIGGDECMKTRWQSCSLCQTRIKTEGLKDEYGLQSWFINRIGKYLEQKGKRIIGWDEILEGGLPEGATIMSWRGMEGGIAAARMNHQVIMTPGSHCYFDHYQADPELSPLAIGGFTPVDKVYSFEPVPFDSLSDVQQGFITGAQGNVWTEYIRNFSQVEYMAFPRAIALSEVLWSDRKARNWPDFSNRLSSHLRRLSLKAVNFSTDLFNVTASVSLDSSTHQILISLTKLIDNGNIHYTTDGTEPDLSSPVYTSPILIKNTGEVKAKLFSEYGTGKTMTQLITLHKLTGFTYELTSRPKHYDGGSPYGLTNGITGKINQYNTWVGFSGDDMEVTIDLKNPTSIKRVSVNFYNKNRSWIYLPLYIEVYSSEDGMDFYPIAKQEIISDEKANSIINTTFLIPEQRMRYLKIHARNTGVCPPGSVCEGQKAWLFADELIVE